MIEESAQAHDSHIIKVIVKSEKQTKEEENTHTFFNQEEKSVTLKNQKEHKFEFKHILGPKTGKQEFFNEAMQPLIKGMFSGIDSVLLSYGCMQDKVNMILSDYESMKEQQLIPNLVKHIFERIKKDKSAFKVKINFYEIITEKIYDLLQQTDLKNQQLKIRQYKYKGIVIQNISTLIVNNIQEFYELYQKGYKNLLIFHTKMSMLTTRSSIILSIILQNQQGQVFSRINIVKVAQFNKNNTSQKFVIPRDNIPEILTKIASREKFIPYRDTKLSRILQKSFKNTVFLANVHPSIEYSNSNITNVRIAHQIQKRMIVAPQN